MESRLAEIEIKLSFAEDLLEALNSIVIRQQRQIDKLQQELCALSQQLQPDEAPAAARDLREERPPHY